jgi:glutathione peroxidase
LLGSGLAMACPETLNFDNRVLAGDEVVNLCERYSVKVLLVVNTANKCAFTPQYNGLEALYRKYKDQGLEVLGFPSNDFGAQEPGTEKQVQAFCHLTYGVEFPMFEKSRVREGNAEPLFQTLARLSGEYPRWNFHKYLIGRDGKLVGSFSSHVTPQSGELLRAIEAQLGDPTATTGVPAHEKATAALNAIDVGRGL